MIQDIKQSIKDRFAELAEQGQRIPITGRDHRLAEPAAFNAWASSAMHITESVFGKESSHYTRFIGEFSRMTHNYIDEHQLNVFRGIFNGAKSDIDGGYVFNLSTTISGEIFGDIVAAAKSAMAEGKQVVACVPACTALEDALKRYASANDLNVEGKTMEEVINSLKSKSLVSGAQKGLLSAMPKIRNYAMHADWEKITPQDAGSVIGYVEHFLLEHFS